MRSRQARAGLYQKGARIMEVRPVAPTQPHLARLRVERQHRLIEELRLAGGRHATAEELAAALGVDGRTIERDIARLREVGVPIAARRGPGGGFRLDVPTAVAPVHLSAGEIAALIASVASVGPYVSATARSALDHLIEALQPRGQDAGSGRTMPPRSPTSTP
jgi:predicted DNA-binding transcriptional regulator YafY